MNLPGISSLTKYLLLLDGRLDQSPRQSLLKKGMEHVFCTLRRPPEDSKYKQSKNLWIYELLSLHPPFIVRALALVPLIKRFPKLAALSYCHQRCGRSDEKEDVENFQLHSSAAEHWAAVVQFLSRPSRCVTQHRDLWRSIFVLDVHTRSCWLKHFNFLCLA